jgi:hypothetical protein
MADLTWHAQPFCKERHMADELVTVGNFQFLPEAEFAQMRLEDEGIQAFVADGQTLNNSWFLGNAIGCIKLQVPAAQAQAAAAILERMRALQKDRDTSGHVAIDVPVCLACGAELAADQSNCSACGWSYAVEDGAALAEEQPPAEEEGSATLADKPGPMETFRSLKRPIFLVMLTPIILMAGFIAVAVVLWLIKVIFR